MTTTACVVGLKNKLLFDLLDKMSASYEVKPWKSFAKIMHFLCPLSQRNTLQQEVALMHSNTVVVVTAYSWRVNLAGCNLSTCYWIGLTPIQISCSTTHNIISLLLDINDTNTNKLHHT